MFTLIYPNFEWKHSNMRLSFYIWCKIIAKYKMVAKMLWPLIQVNLLILMKSRSLHNSRKKGIWFLLRFFMKQHPPPLFSVTKITKNADIHSPLMHDVIIEQLHACSASCSCCHLKCQILLSKRNQVNL